MTTLCVMLATLSMAAQNGNAMMTNPVLFADVPDLDIIRVDDTYYMVSTTMHFAPGCGIMKSKDLVNWEIINYAYDEIDAGDKFRLLNGQSDYSQGSWAANLRYDPYNGVNAALRHVNVVARIPIAPDVGYTAVGRKCCGLALAKGAVANDGRSWQILYGQG